MALKRVAVVGSADPSRTDYHPSLRNTGAAEAACHTLGRAIADAGMQLIVYSAEKTYIEGHVVAGYTSAMPKLSRRHRIRVVFPSSQPQAADFPERATYPTLFELCPDGNPQWEVSFYQSLRDADAVVLVGGGQSTFITGVVAKAFRKPVVALSCFGGAAEEIWKSLVSERDLPSDEAIRDMASEPDEETSRRLVDSLRTQEKRRRVAARQQSGAWRSVGAVFLLVLWVLLLPIGHMLLPAAGAQAGPAWRAVGFVFVLFLAPVLAGISGATIRLVRRPARDGAPSSTVLGAGAGAAAGLLYIASQIVGGTPLHNFAWLLFAAIFGFVGGLTFDRVFARLEETDVVRSDVFTQ